MADNRKKNILRYSKYIHLKIECEINTMLAGKGITAAQSHVLMYIMEHNGEPVFSTAIHHDLNISRATVSGLIKSSVQEDIFPMRAVMMTSVTRR